MTYTVLRYLQKQPMYEWLWDQAYLHANKLSLHVFVLGLRTEWDLNFL